MYTSALMQKFETLRHQAHSAEMSWVRSVLGPKCPYTLAVSVRVEDIPFGADSNEQTLLPPGLTPHLSAYVAF